MSEGHGEPWLIPQWLVQRIILGAFSVIFGLLAWGLKFQDEVASGIAEVRAELKSTREILVEREKQSAIRDNGQDERIQANSVRLDRHDDQINQLWQRQSK